MDINDCKEIYKDFKKRIDKSAKLYGFDHENDQTQHIGTAIKQLYIEQICFEYVMEKYYADSRNPFTTVYSQIMNSLTYEEPTDKFFTTTAEFLLYRVVKEKENGTYTVYK
jgi:hypothetical protein